MQLRSVLLGVCLVIAFHVYSQQSDFMNFVPVSPNAASLGKFGNIPVGYYTGIPTIEVPLYTIEQRKLKIPIKISYHAGGIKVSEIASWVGLGWALNAGGSIVRNERGLQDDMLSVGYLTHGKTLSTGGLNIADYYNAGKGWLDLESDEYMFNFPGGSGKFLLTQQATAFTVPYQPVKILPLGQSSQPYSPGMMEGIRGWKVISTDGTQYYFEAMEVTEQPLQTSNNTHNSAWQLTKIVSSDTYETITFQYDDAPYSTQIPIGQSKTELLPGTSNPCNANTSSTTSTYLARHLFNQKRLRKIIFSNGSIEFIPSTLNRCDLPGEEWLDKIVVSDNQGILVKEFIFKYGYMVGTTITPVESVSCPAEIDARFMLLSVKETGNSAYTFEYIHDKGLPSRYSKAQDHWGFYNRTDNGILTLVPSKTTLANGQVILGEEREANFDFGKQGMLRKITYTTGGTTEFEFEAHHAVLSSLTNFPEYAGSYNIETNPDRSVQLDYGLHNAEVTTFTVNYLQSGTTVYLKTENFIEASGSYFIVENSSGEKMNCFLTKREGATRFYSCPNLPNGTYKIKTMRSYDTTSAASGQTYTLTILSYENVTSAAGNSLTSIGGARIKRITDTDFLTGNVQRKEFEYSPGYLVWGLSYRSFRKQYLCWNLQGSMLSSYILADYDVLNSNSNYPLSNTQGAPVGYSDVIMREYSVAANGERNENGYTAFFYTSPATYPDIGFHSNIIKGHPLQQPPTQSAPQWYSDGTQANYKFPYAPPRSYDWKRGLLLGKSVNRRNADGSYTQLLSETNEYQVSSLPGTIQNVRCAVFFDAGIPSVEGSTTRPINAPEDEVVFSYYDCSNEYIALKKNRIANFSNDRVVTTETEYYYDNSQHLLPNRIIKTIDHDEKETTVVNYPQDYTSGTTFIDALILANNISVPIESVSLRQDVSGGQTVISGQLFNYSDDGKGLLVSVKQVEAATGIDIANFNFSNRTVGIIPSAGTPKTIFSPYSAYVTKATLLKYQGGAVAEAQGADNIIQSYIWDYDNQYVVASVKNALNKDIAFASFETLSTGNWGIGGGQVSTSSFTGARGYSVSNGNTFTVSGLTTGKYKVSYWSQNGALTSAGTVVLTRQKGSWTYYEIMFNNVTSVSLTASTNTVIDDLRLYPEGAQMTSYTYKSLVGLSSVSDANSNPVYYEYDTNGRLKVLRDVDGKIVSHYKYHYKGE